MARNVRIVTGGYAPQDRAEALADAISVRALRSRAPQQGGPVQVAMNPWEGVAQLGEAWIANRMNKRADTLAEAEQARALAANDAMIRQLAGEKAPQRMNEQNQPTGASVEMPTDLDGRPMMLSDKAEQLSAAMAGMDPKAGNQVLSAAVLQRALRDPEQEEGYTLTPGAARFKGGKQVASMPTEAKQPDLPEGMRLNPSTGQPEWIPGYLDAKARLAAAGRSTTSITYDPDGSNRYGAAAGGVLPARSFAPGHHDDARQSAAKRSGQRARKGAGPP